MHAPCVKRGYPALEWHPAAHSCLQIRYLPSPLRNSVRRGSRETGGWTFFWPFLIDWPERLEWPEHYNHPSKRRLLCSGKYQWMCDSKATSANS